MFRKGKQVNYFSPAETSCKCGCGMDILPATRAVLNSLRAAYGKPISLTSAARCAAYNAKIGGAKNSAHVEGKAADLSRTPELFTFVMAHLEQFDLYMEHPDSTPTWLHVQTRPTVNRVFRP